MGFDFFSNNSNVDSLEKRRMYFYQISFKTLSKKRSLSKEITINPQIKNNYLNRDFKDNTKFNDDKNKEKQINENHINKNINISTEKLNNIFDEKNNGKVLSDDEEKGIDLKINKLRFSGKKTNTINKKVIKDNTIFIFDWDDTLFFTTHLDPIKNNSLFNESQKEKRMMKSIEFYVEEILKKALSKGTVFIITNSSEGWVQSCTYSYYPNLIPLLKKINIISARALYEKEFPSNPLLWKIKAFNDLKERFDFKNNLFTNIICIGDDNSEIIAAKSLSKKLESCLIKTIKLRESPKLKELIKQLILVDEQFLRICSYPKSLTIQVGKIKNPKKSY